MAVSLKQKDIVAFLLQGGDISTLKDYGVTTKNLMGAFLSSPELLSKYKTQSKAEASPYAAFDPTYEYDPAININAVESKYYAMPDKYATFAKDFWDRVKSVGANPSEVARIKQDIVSKREAYASQAGLNVDEFNELYGSLTKDVELFQGAEARREKAQYGAFYKKRKDLGITGEGTEAQDEYLESKTGIAGLVDLPSSVEDFVKQKSGKFISGLKGKVSGKSQADYQKQFEDALTKKVGKNYSKYAVKDLLTKNLLGK